MRRVVGAGLAFGALAMTGCQAVLGLGDLSPENDAGEARDAVVGSDGSRDATKDARDAATRDAGDATIVGDGGDAGACPIVYVSASGGHDDVDGCDKAHPKATIASALLGQKRGGQVWVCEGSYAEIDLTVTEAIGLHGGYECSTWQRPSTWGYPRWTTPTTITNSPMSVAAHSATLAVGTTSPPPDAAAGTGAGFAVDGFIIYGASTYPQSYAATIHNGFNPIFSNNHLIGGTLPTTNPAANLYAGALYISAAAPDVTLNRIEFSGPVGGPALAVVVESDGTSRSAAHVHGNVILSAEGVGNAHAPDFAGSIGLAYTSSVTGPGTAFTTEAGAACEGNAITAGFGGALSGKAGAVGLYVSGAQQIDAIGNVINGGSAAPQATGDAAPPNPATAGVAVYGGATVNLLGNHIYGGEQTGGAGGTVGVVAGSASHVTLVNNLIHGGEIIANDPSVTTRAISLNHIDGGVIEDNTLYAGTISTSAPITATGTMYALQLLSAHGATVRGNILGGSGVVPAGVGATLVDVDECSEIGTFEGNLFVGDTSGTNPLRLLIGCHLDGGVGAVSNVRTVDEALHVNEGPRNVLLTETCDAVDVDAGLCAGSCAAGTCMQTLLAGFSTIAGDGVLVTDGGTWSLRDGAACAIATGGVDLSHTDAGPIVTTDIVDASRPLDGSSMGAWQYRGACH